MAFDANLGSFSSSAGPASYSNNTTAASAANARIVVLISSWSSTNAITGVTIGGTAATRDLLVTNANGQDVFSIWSRPVAGGLASGSAIVATFNGTMGGVLVGVLSLTGVDMTNAGGVAGTGSSATQTGTAWSSGTASAAGDTATGGAGNEIATTETSTPTTGTEVHDLWNATAQQGFATGYNVGGTSVAGTFSVTSTATTGGIVAYTAAAAAGIPDLTAAPMHR